MTSWVAVGKVSVVASFVKSGVETLTVVPVETPVSADKLVVVSFNNVDEPIEAVEDTFGSVRLEVLDELLVVHSVVVSAEE